MATAQPITTAQQLWEAGDIGSCELVRGELIMTSPGGFEHGDVAAIISTAMFVFAREQKLGKVVGAGTGFFIERNPDTVRSPDVAVVREARISGRIPAYFPGAPDLAVEVISPYDRRRDVEAKAQMWLDTGCEVVWVVDPPTQTIAVLTRHEPIKLYQVGESLECPTLLPGFKLDLAELFADEA